MGWGKKEEKQRWLTGSDWLRVRVGCLSVSSTAAATAAAAAAILKQFSRMPATWSGNVRSV